MLFNEVKCDMCNITFIPESSDDIYEDEAGTYHAECHDKWVTMEGVYYGRLLGFIR
jgi:rubredoxin